MMRRTMIFLPNEMHQGLKRLAVERDRSVAELVREAVLRAYREDLDDIHDAEQELAKYKRGIEYAAYRSKRLRG